MAKKQHKSAAIDIPAVVQAKRESVSYPTKRWTFNELPGWLQSESADTLAHILTLAEKYIEQGWSKHEALVEAETEWAVR